MDRGHGEIGDGSDISAAPLINAAARMKGSPRCASSLSSGLGHVISEPSLLEIRLLPDTTLPFGVFTRSQPLALPGQRCARRVASPLCRLAPLATVRSLCAGKNICPSFQRRQVRRRDRRSFPRLVLGKSQRAWQDLQSARSSRRSHHLRGPLVEATSRSSRCNWPARR